MRHFNFILHILTSLILCLATSAHAVPSGVLVSHDWVLNGPVYAMASDGVTTCVGGRFSRVGAYTGSGIPFNIVSGSSAATYPKVDGTVNAVATDGSGGWFIGGSFVRTGETEQITTKIRFISTTSKTISDLQASGELDQELISC